ncbi:hypothetical protein Tco_0644504 [Tanacetum coccineum]
MLSGPGATNQWTCRGKYGKSIAWSRDLGVGVGLYQGYIREADDRCVWIVTGGSAFGIMGPEVYKKLVWSVGSSSTKNVNNDSVSTSSRFLREGMCVGVGKVILVDSLKKGEISDDSVLFNDGCIKDCMGMILEDDAW